MNKSRLTRAKRRLRNFKRGKQGGCKFAHTELRKRLPRSEWAAAKKLYLTGDYLEI